MGSEVGGGHGGQLAGLLGCAVGGFGGGVCCLPCLLGGLRGAGCGFGGGAHVLTRMNWLGLRAESRARTSSTTSAAVSFWLAVG